MGHRLPDGTIYPSFLGVQDKSHVSQGGDSVLSDNVLRVGEVRVAYSPSAPENTNKVVWEYVVQVNSYRDGVHGSPTTQLYRAVVADTFGNSADHIRYTIRPATAKPQPGQAVSNGSLVLVACVGGDKSQAVILGAWRQPREGDVDPSEPFYEFEFNGVKARIGADGSLSLVVPGPTNLSGGPGDRDSDNHGSNVSFGKDGAIKVSDEAGETITITPAKKTIEVTAGKQTSTIKDTWKLKAATVTVIAQKVNLGGEELEINPLDEVVVGSGIDTFTGSPFFALGDTSKIVKAKKQ